MRLAGMMESVTAFCLSASLPKGREARQHPWQIGDVSMAITDNG